MKLIPFIPSPLDIEATLEVQAHGFLISFEVTGSGLEKISVSPANPAPARKNDLWKETCFECFFGVGGSSRYFEFNGSTSGNWALYSFDDYRKGMKEVAMTASPVMEKFEKTADKISCVWRIPYFTGSILQGAGITAVIRNSDDSISHWALKHVGNQADFHLRNSFTHRFI